MQLTHSFTVPAGIEQAWQVLLDIERIAPCMPGAALESVDGDEFTGSVKVRLGPIGLTYRGKARWVTRDADSHRAVIDAQGKDARGNGTAKATITATLTGSGQDSTEVSVVTDLTITGKPAQFGRGVMVDVGNKLIGQFADCLAGKLSEPQPAGVGSGEAAGGGKLAGPTSDTAEREVAETLRGVEFDTGEQLGIADQDAADPLGQAGPAPSGASGTASAPGGAGGSTPGGSGSGPGPAEPEQNLTEPGEPGPSLAAPGLADPDVVEAGEAGLRESTVATDAATAGAGALTDAATAGPATDGATAGAGPAGGAAVVAVPGPAPGEQPVEPAAASEAAPPAQRADAGSAPPSTAPVAHRPPPQRPSVAEVEPIDLLSSAGPAVAKRLAPVAAVLALLVVWLLARRRRY